MRWAFLTGVLALSLCGARTIRADEPIEREADVLAFVGEHQPELLPLLEALKPMNAKEYRKAIRDLSQARDRLVELQKRGAPKYPLLLESWKARTRVDVLAARMAGDPSAEAETKLREAIAANLDVEVQLQRFELEQAEAAVKNHRRVLEKLETDRAATLEARFRAAQPKRANKIGKKDKDKGKDKPILPVKDKDAGAVPAAGSPRPKASVPGETRP